MLGGETQMNNPFHILICFLLPRRGGIYAGKSEKGIYGIQSLDDDFSFSV